MRSEVVFACDMGALEPGQRREHHDVMRALFGAVVSVRPAGDGYRFTLADSDEVVALVGRFIALERRCCPFFDFGLCAAPDEAPELVIRGPAGVEPFIQAEFGAVLPLGVGFPSNGAQQ